MLSSNSYGTNLGEFTYTPQRRASGPTTYYANGITMNQNQFDQSGGWGGGGFKGYSPYYSSPRRIFEPDDELRMKSNDMIRHMFPNTGIYGGFLNNLMNSGRMGGMSMNTNTNMLGRMGGGT